MKFCIKSVLRAAFSALAMTCLYMQAEELAAIRIIKLSDLVQMEMVRIDPGTFTMSAKDGLNSPDEVPHRVVLTSPFYLGRTELTQRQWKAVMRATHPTNFKGDELPVENIRRDEVMRFCEILNDRGLAPKGWRLTLPTEAQWEFAARGGNKSKRFKYSGSNNLDKVAWHKGNSVRQTHPVGTKAPNELGLFDMSGNVSEWCLDDYSENSVGAIPETDDFSDHKSWFPVKGGNWESSPRGCRPGTRTGDLFSARYANLGFRIALVQIRPESTELTTTDIPDEFIQQDETLLKLKDGALYLDVNVKDITDKDFFISHMFGSSVIPHGKMTDFTLKKYAKEIELAKQGKEIRLTIAKAKKLPVQDAVELLKAVAKKYPDHKETSKAIAVLLGFRKDMELFVSNIVWVHGEFPKYDLAPAVNKAINVITNDLKKSEQKDYGRALKWIGKLNRIAPKDRKIQQGINEIIGMVLANVKSNNTEEKDAENCDLLEMIIEYFPKHKNIAEVQQLYGPIKERLMTKMIKAEVARALSLYLPTKVIAELEKITKKEEFVPFKVPRQLAVDALEAYKIAWMFFQFTLLALGLAGIGLIGRTVCIQNESKNPLLGLLGKMCFGLTIVASVATLAVGAGFVVFLTKVYGMC